MTEIQLVRRYQGYAAKFVNDCELAPTDENLKSVLDNCIRRAKRSEYPSIRKYVHELRKA